MADDDQTNAIPEGDVLPEDLDVTAFVGPYMFPSMRRRRIPAYMYVVLGILCLGGYALTSNNAMFALPVRARAIVRSPLGCLIVATASALFPAPRSSAASFALSSGSFLGSGADTTPPSSDHVKALCELHSTPFVGGVHAGGFGAGGVFGASGGGGCGGGR